MDLAVRPGQVTCVLGDNGAGKSTLIKIVSGLHRHTEGEFLVDGLPVHFSTPREALDKGIATVYQDLATVPLMPVWRNFFLGSELTKGPWPVRRLDIQKMKRTADEELRNMGIILDDLEQPIGNSPAVSASASRSPAPSTSARVSSSSTSPPPPSASSSPAWS